jgi:hypothetical protein
MAKLDHELKNEQLVTFSICLRLDCESGTEPRAAVEHFRIAL